MKNKLEYFLGKWGFKKLSDFMPGFSIYFTIENHYVNAVCLVDADEYTSITKEQYDQVTKRTSWKFMDGGCVEVHMLVLVLCSDMERALCLTEGESFGWIVHTGQNKLIIVDGKAENFYGLREKISECLTLPYSDNMRLEEPIEYNVKGQPYYKSIKQRPLVNHLIFVINTLVFTGCYLTGNYFYSLGILDYQKVMEGEWYRILTSMFLHADITHLAGNMMILFFLGDIVERALGHIKYLILYLISGIVGAIGSMMFTYVMQDYRGSLGASGAIFGMIGALLWILIRNHGHLETMTIPKILFLIGFSLYRGFTGTNIDNAAHIAGLMAGFILAMLLYHKKKVKREKVADEN